jgi:hypothetical protein
MVCCIAAAFVFGLIVRTLQTVFRRRQDATDVHPTPVRRVTDDSNIESVPVEADERDDIEFRTPVGV